MTFNRAAGGGPLTIGRRSTYNSAGVRMARVTMIDRLATRTTSGLVIAMALALGMPLLLSGCGAAAPSRPAILLVIRDDAATGPDYQADGRIENASDADYFELRIRRSFASVIVMTTGTTDTAGQLQTADRMAITKECEGTELDRPCVFSYDADTAHNDARNAAFNSMEPSGNFVWEGNLPGPEGVEEYRRYYIRVTGENGSTGDYVLTVELNEGEGPMYS